MVPSVHDLVQQNLTRWAFRLTEHNVENDGVEYLEFNIRFGHSPLKMRLMVCCCHSRCTLESKTSCMDY
jgi:hypothetical protein